MRAVRHTLPWVALAMGCGTGAVEVCPQSDGNPIAGDSNGDGVHDVADGVYTARHMLAGGPPPVCTRAANLESFTDLDLGDAFTSWNALFLEPVTLPEPNCVRSTRAEPPACGRMAWSIDAPRRASGSQFTAEVSLVTRDLPVDGWSVAVVAEGCAIEAATVEGTIAADGIVGEGMVMRGFELTETVAGAAYSAVVLDWSEPVQVPPSREGHPVLSLDVVSDTTECGPCVLRTADGVDGLAAPVDTVITHAGWSYRPPQAEHTTQVCP